MTLPAPTNPASPEELTEAQGVSSLTGDEHLKWASPEEALAGTEAAKMISPLTLKHVLDNAPEVIGPEIDDTSSSLTKVWSASKLSGAVGDTAQMLDGILGDGDEIASLKGEDGTDGATILTGAVDPTTEGAIGDVYINTATMQLFGPKTSGGWGTGTSLQGGDGTDGKTVLSGAVDPTTQGVDGDWYINKTSLQIFGPKASGAWGTGVDLKGTDGADGAIGPTFSISENHFFADATARDAYFSSNPSELVAGVVISVTAGSTGYQQYSGSAWIDKEFAIEGGGGVAKGLHLTLSANQGPASGSKHVLFNTVVKNDGGFSLNTGVITVAEAGWYLITANIALTTYSSTIHMLTIADSADAELLRSTQPLNLAFYGTSLAGAIYLAAGAQIKVIYYTATSTTILASVGGQTLLTMVKL